MLATWRKPSRYIRNCGLATFAPIMAVFAAVVVMFEMTLPQPHHEMVIDVPKITWPHYLPNAMREDAIIVTISRDGSVFVGRDKVEAERVAEHIRENLEHGSERTVYIRADARTLYHNVKQVIDAVQESKLMNVIFFVDQRRTSRQREKQVPPLRRSLAPANDLVHSK
jgi:biopolymer transport protein ExbD/biopolymer transport protein TolR